MAVPEQGYLQELKKYLRGDVFLRRFLIRRENVPGIVEELQAELKEILLWGTNKKLVEFLTNNNVDVNALLPDGTPPIWLLFRDDANKKKIATMIKHGANGNARDNNGAPFLLSKRRQYGQIAATKYWANGGDITLRDAEGNTVLHKALPLVYNDILWYVEKGVDPTVANNNLETPMHYIVRYNFNAIFTVIQRYIEKGADPNARDIRGNTPVHAFVENAMKHSMDPERLFQVLEEGGARIDLENNEGKRPVELISYETEGARRSYPYYDEYNSEERDEWEAQEDIRVKQEMLWRRYRLVQAFAQRGQVCRAQVEALLAVCQERNYNGSMNEVITYLQSI